jgi:hypothetical protein
MIKRKLITAISLCCFALLGNAQEADKVSYFLKNTSVDLGGSFGSNQFAGSLAWTKLHGLGQSGNFKIGYGVRFGTYNGTHQNYLTAPAKITGAKDFNNSYDTLHIKKASMSSLNLALYFQYTFFKKLDVGFNIDAIGVSFGKSSTADYSTVKYKPSDMPQIAKFETTVNAKPTSLNALLVGDNDLGTLSSEFLVRYWVTEKIGVKAMFNYLFTEYTTDKLLRAGTNDRYRNKSPLIGLGITFKIK